MKSLSLAINNQQSPLHLTEFNTTVHSEGRRNGKSREALSVSGSFSLMRVLSPPVAKIPPLNPLPLSYWGKALWYLPSSQLYKDMTIREHYWHSPFLVTLAIAQGCQGTQQIFESRLLSTLKLSHMQENTQLSMSFMSGSDALEAHCYLS